MSKKSNKKQNRTNGSIVSSNAVFPDPITNSNTPLGNFDFTDKQRIERNSVENNKY